ncbi:unnamed protein product [Ectocarpus sp. CCAP 1310/34]|nr:unnamed protein product [Ectocarpus sp. CCAP 1310/34]
MSTHEVRRRGGPFENSTGGAEMEGV